MASFKKTQDLTVTLTSNGGMKDGLLVARWARALIESCDAVVADKVIASTLSAGHLVSVFMPQSITLSFSSYYGDDLSWWLAHCKK
jgi:hypothetical protein